jgi:HSP20 family protein
MANRRTPFDVFDEMDRMIESMRRSMIEGADDIRSWSPGSWSGGSKANLRLERDGNVFVVLADLPGFEREEIDLRFDEQTLVLDARHETSEQSEFGAMSRSRQVHESIRVPGEVDIDGIAASYRNGVLEVRLPALDSVSVGDAHRIDIE